MSEPYNIEETQELARAVVARMDKLAELKAVRAFVARIEDRLGKYSSSTALDYMCDFYSVFQQEYAAMEAEAIK